MSAVAAERSQPQALRGQAPGGGSQAPGLSLPHSASDLLLPFSSTLGSLSWGCSLSLWAVPVTVCPLCNCQASCSIALTTQSPREGQPAGKGPLLNTSVCVGPQAPPYTAPHPQPCPPRSPQPTYPWSSGEGALHVPSTQAESMPWPGLEGKNPR